MSQSKDNKVFKDAPPYLARNLGSFPYKLVFFYALISIIWITFSDRALESFISDPHQLSILQTYKGWFYVIISSLIMLFFSLKLIRSAKNEAELLSMRLIDEAPDAIVLFDMQMGKFAYQNSSSEKLFGYTNNEMKNLSPLEISPLHQPNGKASKDAVKDTLELALKGENPKIEWQHLHKSGRPIMCELWLSLFKYGDKSYIRGSMTDISDRIRLQNEVQHLQKVESIGQLAGGVAHDFNNLLTSIVGFAELAKNAKDPNHHLNKILESAQRGSRLTRQLLTFARKQVVEYQVIDVDKVLTFLIPLIERLIRENIKLSYVNRAQKSARIKIDLSNFEQLIINFCVNARDAIVDQGEIHITLDSSDEFVQIIIQDNGTGIPLESQSKIFEPFFTTKENGQGTGLGLAICHSIVQQIGGKLSFHSEEHIGTSFILELSTTTEPVNTKFSFVSEPHSFKVEGTEVILLAEDDDFIREYLEQSLIQLGYTVLIAADGLAALNIFESNPKIDLIITDVVMPNLNGKELIERINKLNTKVKVIFTSGYPEETISHHGILEPGIHFIQKPFTRDALSQKMREVLNEA